VRQRELAAVERVELDPARAAEARAHVAACPDCAEEARWLAAERQLFARRSALAAPPPPPFAAVMARARRGGDEGARAARRARWGGALAAAAAMLGFLATRPGRVDGGGVDAEIVAEPPMELSCFEGQPLAVEREAFVTDGAIASVEDQYGACMLATPLARPARGQGACAPPVDHAVTCDPLGPLEGEVVE
jgi:hypothetical protein